MEVFLLVKPNEPVFHAFSRSRLYGASTGENLRTFEQLHPDLVDRPAMELHEVRR